MFKLLCQDCYLGALLQTKTKIFKNAVFNKRVLQVCSTAVNENLSEWNKIKSKYSDEELTIVSSTVNKCDVKELKKFGILETDIKVLKSLRKKKQYKSLDDLVLHDVLTVSQLQDICSAVATVKKRKYKKSSIVSPALKPQNIHNLKTVVGLRIETSAVSWSHLELTGSHCNILDWNCQSVADIPFNATLPELIQTGLGIANAIPNADAYVMEKQATKPMANLTASVFRFSLRHQQLMSTVLTAIAARNSSKETSQNKFLNSLYMMRPNAPAQQFGLFLGNETVSSSEIIESIIQRQNIRLKNILSISLSDELINSYTLADVYKKEELNKNLLLTITFFESAVLELPNE